MGVVRRALANRWLRRVGFAYLPFGMAELGVWVAVLVYAYQRGGTTLAGIIAVVQLLPSAVVAPLAARLAERGDAGRMLFYGYLMQALLYAGAATLLAVAAPAPTVFVAMTFASCAVVLPRPAQGALLPSLVDTPAQLTAANVVAGWAQGTSYLAGPALAGVMIAIGGPGAALALFAAAVALSAFLVAPLRTRGWAATAEEEGADDSPASILAALRATPGAAPVLAVVAAQYLVAGALDVLEVVLALKVLDLGASGAGYLGAAFGVGAIAGAVGAFVLVGRHRLAVALLGAAVAWGAAFVLIGVAPEVATAFVLLGIAGACNTVLDITTRTMLHRTVPADLHARAFGVLEGLTMLGLAVGSLLVPIFVHIGGVTLAFVATGGFLIVAAPLVLPFLLAAERSAPALEEEFALVQGAALFTMLSAPVVEGLARALVRVPVSAGEMIVREGDTGERFYLVAAGELTVSIGGEYVRTLGLGDGFGEIALLRDGIRTATVTAAKPATLYALERASFLEAVTGSPQATAAADELVTARLGALTHIG